MGYVQIFFYYYLIIIFILQNEITDLMKKKKKKKKKLNDECEPYRFLKYEMIILCNKNVFIQNILKKSIFLENDFFYYYYYIDTSRVCVIIIKISEFVLT